MKEISNIMGLAEQTTSQYAYNVYKKLGVNTRIGLVNQHYSEILSDMQRTKGLSKLLVLDKGTRL